MLFCSRFGLSGPETLHMWGQNRWRVLKSEIDRTLYPIIQPDNPVPGSEIYCTYHVTDSTRTAASLLPLMVRPPGTVSRTMRSNQTPLKLLRGAC